MASMCLSFDTDALQAVNLLDFVHEPAASSFSPLHAQDVVRVRRPACSGRQARNVIAGCSLDVLALRNSGSASLIREQATVDAEGRDHDLALALVSLPNDTCRRKISLMIVIFGLTGFESSATPRQPPVMSCTFVVRADLGDRFTGGDVLAFHAHDVRADGER